MTLMKSVYEEIDGGKEILKFFMDFFFLCLFDKEMDMKNIQGDYTLFFI